jgi:hypothetical protein
MSNLDVKVLQGGDLYLKCRKCGKEAFTRSAYLEHFEEIHKNCSGHIGLGDVIARATSALGIPTCSACQKRQQLLNNAFPKVMKK